MLRATVISAAIAAFLIPIEAQAATTVLGNGLAQVCSHFAKAGEDSEEALHVCDIALETEAMKRRDRAGTYVNRGVIKMRRQEYGQARRDFDLAVKLQPDLGEAYVNRGGALVGQKRYMEALLEIDKGLALGPEEPEKAYYNRGLANEGLADIKAAYLDYRRAVELKPDWEIPARELRRFTVRSAN
jgi:tetratricopeptide (TPR) repeat protein